MNFKHDRISLLCEFLVTQMNHWMLFPIYAMLGSIAGDFLGDSSPHLLVWLAMGIVPFVLYLERYLFRKLWQLISGHLAMILMVFLLPADHAFFRGFQTFVAVGYVIYSVYLWAVTTNKKDIKFHPILAVGLSVLMLVILQSQGHREWDTAFVIILIITLGLYFIVYYMEQYQIFLTVNSSSAGHIPAKEMFHSGMGLVLGYTGVGILLLIIISNFDWLRGILQGGKRLFAYLLAGFFSLFPKGTGSVIEKVEEVVVEEEEPMNIMGGEYETFWLWNVVDVIVEIAFTALILFALVKGILFLVKFVRNKLSGAQFRRQKLSVNEDVVDVREKCDVIRSTEWKVNLPFLNLNPKERIRHLYKKRLLASKTAFSVGSTDVASLGRYTARESSRILNREELAAIYEKARYSDAECGSEDVKRMRNLCK